MTADGEAPDPDLSRRNVRLGAVVLAVLLGAVGLSMLRGARATGAPALEGALRSSLERDGCTADSRTDEGRRHQPLVNYTVDPPAGGDHDAAPSKAGFYEPGTVPTDGHLVHSLEHGFVIVWYKPDSVAPTTLEALRALAERADWVLVAPRASMPTALAATSWHRRLLCPDGALAPIGTFVKTFRDKGPEKGFVAISY
ncbi:MAG TPA: DUF3105 domain-containing protein [Acidimicrobiia bacterium]|nr:DUF3105 domain-containing protein [Acidimicrobiia bacterium]